MTSRHLWLWVIVVCAAVMPVGGTKNKATPKPSAPAITLAVDASDAPRKIFHAQLTIPATPGTLTLYYPKWIPGEHGPTGPIQDVGGAKVHRQRTNLEVAARLARRMDPARRSPGWSLGRERFAGLHFTHRSGRRHLHGRRIGNRQNDGVELEYSAAISRGMGHRRTYLRRQPTFARGLEVWYAIALASQSGAELNFNPASLTMLVDSPVIAGEYLRVVPLSENPRQEMDIAADNPAICAPQLSSTTTKL